MLSDSCETLLAHEHHEPLLAVARTSIDWGLVHGRRPEVKLSAYDAALHPVRATFVTLSIDGELRGCMGTLEPKHALVADVARNAFSAAFRDPRFPALPSRDAESVDIHISILGEPEPVEASSEDELIAKIRPGVDGLVLREGRRRSTLLPAVWRHVTDPHVFLRHLRTKAGLPPTYWSDTLHFERYTVQSVGVERL